VKAVRLSALRTSQEIFLVLISVEGWVYPKSAVRREELSQWKSKPRTFGLSRSASTNFVTAAPYIIRGVCLKVGRSQWPRDLRCGSAAARLLAGIASSNPAGGTGVCLLWVLCCKEKVLASSWSLVQRSPTECSVPECDREASTVKRPSLTWGCQAKKKRSLQCNLKLKYNSIDPRQKALLTIVAQDAVASFLHENITLFPN